MKITEIKGRAQVFTLKDGKTLRILAHQMKEVAESNISKELRIAEQMGLILMTKTDVIKGVTTENKKGGTK